MVALPIRPPVIVHHTAATDGMSAPPNSLEAIRACLDTNADFVEVDVSALKTDDYLLVHELFLEDETTGIGAVSECTADQARELHFKVNAAATCYRVPLLSAVVELFRRHTEQGGTTRLQLDFKNVIPFSNDEPLRRFIRLIEPLGRYVLVSSIADWNLRKLRALAPWLDLGFDIQLYLHWRGTAEEQVSGGYPYPRQRGAYDYWDDHPLALARFWPTAEYLADRCAALIRHVPNVNTFYVQHHLLVQSLNNGFNWAEALHADGIALDAWTLDADDPIVSVNAPRLLQAGVDLLTTNTPWALRKLLN